jgi:HAD superfamily hydrolase (TIGR01484 family)
MRYEAIIFDLDGTAMPSARKSLPSKKLAGVINSYKNKIHLCAATGRSWDLAREVIQILALVDPCILSGGAVIVDPRKEKILWQKAISQNALNAILKVVQDYDYPVDYAVGLTTTAILPREVIKLSSEINAFYILDIPQDKANKVLDKLTEVEGITVSKAHSWNVAGGIDFHITNSQGTKEHAVTELCRILNVDRANVAGVGDGHNDIHLFNSVGHKVAMGNAVPELKEIADEIIEPIDKEGLAKFIKSSVSS